MGKRAAAWRQAAGAAMAACATLASAGVDGSEAEYPRDFAPALVRYEPYVPPPKPAAQRPVRLDAKTLAQLALAQNAEVLYARLQSRVSEQAAEAESGLYMPVAYANLRREGRNAERVASFFADNPDVHVPRVHWDLTRRRVLVMDFEPGIKVTDVGAGRAAGGDVDRLGGLLGSAYCEPILARHCGSTDRAGYRAAARRYVVTEDRAAHDGAARAEGLER